MAIIIRTFFTATNNNTVAHFPRSISVYLRTRRNVRSLARLLEFARARALGPRCETKVFQLVLTISRSIIDKVRAQSAINSPYKYRVASKLAE